MDECKPLGGGSTAGDAAKRRLLQISRKQRVLSVLWLVGRA